MTPAALPAPPPGRATPATATPQQEPAPCSSLSRTTTAPHTAKPLAIPRRLRPVRRLRGGGWIDWPAGAYAADPTMAGKANFGFVSKYQKASNIPNGTTRFQFHAARLNFHSTVYDWLVVSGPEAQSRARARSTAPVTTAFCSSLTTGRRPGWRGGPLPHGPTSDKRALAISSVVPLAAAGLVSLPGRASSQARQHLPSRKGTQVPAVLLVRQAGGPDRMQRPGQHQPRGPGAPRHRSPPARLPFQEA